MRLLAKVKKGNRSQGSRLANKSAMLTIGIILVLSFARLIQILNLDDHDSSPWSFQNMTPLTSFTSSWTTDESPSLTIETWHKDFNQRCQDTIATLQTSDTQAKKAVEEEPISKIKFPSNVTDALPSDHAPYKFCRNVFIDLGTNIGDTIGYFVDNALDVCTVPWVEKYPDASINDQFPRPHLDVANLNIIHEGRNPNGMYLQIQQYMKRADQPISANSFCVYGMEGNPVFTERLQKLENYIMGAQPRPIEHLHIHTESVITAVDGPTKLHLDKLTVSMNFWGSSVLNSAGDPMNTAKKVGGGELVSADVQGISLSTLVKRTALAFKPTATPEEQTGGTMIIKMDVEGAEFQVMKEIASSGVLCDLASKGNRVFMIVEYHDFSIRDAEERNRELDGLDEAKQTLSDCGIILGDLLAGWA